METNNFSILDNPYAGDINLDSGLILTVEKRMEIYKKALDVYANSIIEEDMSIGLCNSIHKAGIILNYWQPRDYITKPIKESDGSTKLFYYQIGYNQEFLEVMIAAKLNKANFNFTNETVNNYGFWWDIFDTESRISTLKYAIELCERRIANRNAIVNG